jgi:hypothetical protein
VQLTESEKNKPEEELPLPWKKIQSAIWLIGLAILFWQGWIWPGILVLVAVSGLFQAGVQFYLSKQAEQHVQTEQDAHLYEQRASWLPGVCPTCGAPINVSTVHWTGPATASCPYCSANLKPAA